jgi:DNA-binding NarL/FixJ family response regulator
MNEVYNTLHLIQQTFQQNRNEVISDVALLQALSDSCPYLSFIIDVESKSLCHVNEKVVNYFNIPKDEMLGKGTDFAEQLLHPEYSHVLPLALAHYSNPDNYHTIYPYMYFMKSAEDYQWIYACSQVVAQQCNGAPKYILIVACNINTILDSKNNSATTVSEMDSLNHLGMERYISLSCREKQILRLISKEYTTNEIAEKLFISKATVDSHRKNLLRKLNVKSAIGLTKYVLLFDTEPE